MAMALGALLWGCALLSLGSGQKQVTLYGLYTNLGGYAVEATLDIAVEHMRESGRWLPNYRLEMIKQNTHVRVQSTNGLLYCGFVIIAKGYSFNGQFRGGGAS